MAKRFEDTNKYKKPFIRGLKGAYKVLWDYICLDCDHAGIWQADFEIAQIYIGKDMPVNSEDAIKFFNEDEERIVLLDGGNKWFIKPFVDFQYGVLNPENRAHNSVIQSLNKHNLTIQPKGLITPLEGCKDMDMDKDKDKVKEYCDDFLKFWTIYPRKQAKGDAYRAWKKIKGVLGILPDILKAVELQINCPQWKKDGGQFIPKPATWLNGKRWLDEVQKDPMQAMVDEMNRKDLEREQGRSQTICG